MRNYSTTPYRLNPSLLLKARRKAIEDSIKAYCDESASTETAKIVERVAGESFDAAVEFMTPSETVHASEPDQNGLSEVAKAYASRRSNGIPIETNQTI